jgi:putative transposase
VGDAGALPVRFDAQLPHRAQLSAHANPFSEAQFKTMKYRPDFPARFGCLADARAFCQEFFAWYNTVHRHSGIGYMTPHSIHYGTAQEIHATRQSTLDDAFLAHPIRFKGNKPQPHSLPTEVWINPPPKDSTNLNKQQHRTLN